MKQETVVTIGTFDGIHMGHQAILQEVRKQAQDHSLPSVAFAFATPPRQILNGTLDRCLILPQHLKEVILLSYVARVQSVPFEAVREMSPAEFFDTVLVGDLNARVVVEGSAFRFGRDRAGTLESLRTLGRERGISVVGVPPVILENEPVSSTRIREAIRQGDLPLAKACLGRPPVLVGNVERGDQLGSGLGYPTANLSLDPAILMPPSGIYLAHVHGADVAASGLLYIGARPTLGSHGRSRQEVHILDFPERSLYGEVLEVHLLEKLRDDRAFSSLDALRVQIAADIASARSRLPAYPAISARIGS